MKSKKKILTRTIGIVLILLGIASLLYISHIPDEMQGGYLLISIMLLACGIGNQFN